MVINSGRPKCRHRALWAACLLLLAFTLSQPDSVGAQTQWIPSGDNLYNSPSTGKVGVGTTTPTAQLHLTKELRIDGTDVGGGYRAIGFGGNLIGINPTIYTSGNYLVVNSSIGHPLYLNFDNSTGNTIVQANGGLLGIGTTNPLNKQHVYTTGSNDGISVDGTTNPGFNFRNSGTIKGYFGLATGANGWATGSAANDVVLRTEDATNGNIRFVTQAGSLTPMIITRGGTIGIATIAPNPAAKLHVAGAVQVDGNITNSGNIMATGTISAGNVIAKYQDIAEWVPASIAIPVATVVVLDSEKSNHVLASFRAYDTRVAGVISERPGVVLGEGGVGKVLVATTGRVRVKVDATAAPIRVGDLLVTSDKEGIAMKSLPLDLSGTPIHRPGTLIGKALEPLEKGVGEILVLLSLQ